MYFHYFKIIWNRKRQHVLLLLEMFIAFLVLCILFVFSGDLLLKYLRPLGFSYENRWVIDVNFEEWDAMEWNATNQQRLELLLSELKRMEGVEGVSLTNMAPYSMSMSISMDSLPLLAKQYQIYLYSGDDDFVETMGLELVEGRWFGPEDDAVDFRPAVVNARYARHAYPGEDPLGKEVMPRYRTGSFANRTGKPTRIVGVVNDYRKGGEFDEAEYGMFFRETYRSYDTLATGEDPPRIPSSFVLKVDPSRMSAAFEEEVQAVFAQFMPGWSVYMQPMEQMRADRMRDRLNPLLAFALVALFLVVMVGLGLVGVIGQNVLARTSELGLRRAVGATRGQIFAQVLGELFVLVALAIALGTLVVVQFPLLGAFEGELTWGVFSLGWGAAVVFLLLLAVICGFYPSKNATTVQPTSALQEV